MRDAPKRRVIPAYPDRSLCVLCVSVPLWLTSVIRKSGGTLAGRASAPLQSITHARPPAPHRPRPRRPRPGGRRRAGRRPVHDDDRHRRCRGDGAAGRRAVAGRLRDGARDGERARGGGRGARDQAAHARCRVRRAAHRRLPLQRPPAAHPLPRDRARAGQVPHQPRQRRHRQAARRAVRDHLQGGRATTAGPCASASTAAP